MDKDREYPSDSDGSDQDFCPDNESDSDIPSEEESDYKGSDSEDEKKVKSSRKSTKRTKKKSKSKVVEVQSDNESFEKNDPVSEAEEKKRSDDLWANFLSDVNDTKNDCSGTSGTVVGSHQDNKILSNTNAKIELKTKVQSDKEVKKVKVTEILEFAGEEIEVTKEITIEPEKKNIQLNTSKQNRNLLNILSKVPLKRSGGGLSSVLGQIEKKTKISVLEKSKLDWDGFKKKEGLKEELHTFNKGKDGFLEKQDFLQRTDVRQFEIEKSLRQSKRKY